LKKRGFLLQLKLKLFSIGTAGMTTPIPLENGIAGHFGLTGFLVMSPSLTPEDICWWLLLELPTLVGPYPGPRFY
jgi:hypothetical protein